MRIAVLYRLSGHARPDITAGDIAQDAGCSLTNARECLNNFVFRGWLDRDDQVRPHRFSRA